MGRPVTILRSEMSDDEVQIALAPSRSGGTVIVSEVRGLNDEYLYLDFHLMLDEPDLTVVAYFNMFRFVTVGVLYEGYPVAWDDLPDEVRMRIRKVVRKRNIPTETLRYSDDRYGILEGLEASL